MSISLPSPRLDTRQNYTDPSLPPSLPTEVSGGLVLALLPGHELDPGDGGEQLHKGQRALGRDLREGGREGRREGRKEGGREGGKEGGREGGVGQLIIGEGEMGK